MFEAIKGSTRKKNDDVSKIEMELISSDGILNGNKEEIRFTDEVQPPMGLCRRVVALIKRLKWWERGRGRKVMFSKLQIGLALVEEKLRRWIGWQARLGGNGEDGFKCGANV